MLPGGPVIVPLTGSKQTKSGKKTIKVTTRARNRPLPDTDTLVLRCLPRKASPGYSSFTRLGATRFGSPAAFGKLGGQASSPSIAA